MEAFLIRSDEASFRSLYRAHTPALYRIVWRILGGRDPEAEEVVQATWVRAVERLSRFRWESSLGTWLTGIAINGCREILRRRSRDRAGPATAEAGVGKPQARPNGKNLDLERAVAELPEGSREILVLHDIEGYTHQEIGRLLGIEAGTSKSQLSRARRTLRSCLGGTWGTRNELERPS